MSWFFLALLSVIGVAIQSILQRLLMKGDKTDPYSYTIIFQSLLILLYVPIAIVHGFYFPHIGAPFLFFVLSAIFWGAATYFIFRAMHLLEASEVTILTTTGVIVTILISIVFLHEIFGYQKVLGTAITCIAVIMVTNLKKGFTYNKGVLFALLATSCAGIAIVLDGINVKNYDVISYSIIINALIVVMLLALRPRALTNWRNYFRSNFFKKMLPLGVFSVLQGLTVLLALQTPGVTAQVGAIRQSSVILTVIFAMVFLQERDNIFKKIIAASLVTVGLYFLH